MLTRSFRALCCVRIPTVPIGLAELLGCSGDLVSRLSKGPYRAYHGGLKGILAGLPKSTDHPNIPRASKSP